MYFICISNSEKVFLPLLCNYHATCNVSSVSMFFSYYVCSCHYEGVRLLLYKRLQMCDDVMCNDCFVSMFYLVWKFVNEKERF